MNVQSTYKNILFYIKRYHNDRFSLVVNTISKDDSVTAYNCFQPHTCIAQKSARPAAIELHFVEREKACVCPPKAATANDRKEQTTLERLTRDEAKLVVTNVRYGAAVATRAH